MCIEVKNHTYTHTQKERYIERERERKKLTQSDSPDASKSSVNRFHTCGAIAGIPI